MTATINSTALDATLSVADPGATATGRLMNGAFASLPRCRSRDEPERRRRAPRAPSAVPRHPPSS